MSTDYKCGLEEGDTIKITGIKICKAPWLKCDKEWSGDKMYIGEIIILKKWITIYNAFIFNDGLVDCFIIPWLHEFEIIEKEEDELITVCSKCFRACCWQGYFMCDEAYSAGTIEMEKSRLIRMNLEHESYMTNNNY